MEFIIIGGLEGFLHTKEANIYYNGDDSPFYNLRLDKNE